MNTITLEEINNKIAETFDFQEDFSESLWEQAVSVKPQTTTEKTFPTIETDKTPEIPKEVAKPLVKSKSTTNDTYFDDDSSFAKVLKSAKEKMRKEAASLTEGDKMISQANLSFRKVKECYSLIFGSRYLLKEIVATIENYDKPFDYKFLLYKGIFATKKTIFKNIEFLIRLGILEITANQKHNRYFRFNAKAFNEVARECLEGKITIQKLDKIKHPEAYPKREPKAVKVLEVKRKQEPEVEPKIVCVKPEAIQEPKVAETEVVYKNVEPKSESPIQEKLLWSVQNGMNLIKNSKVGTKIVFANNTLEILEEPHINTGSPYILVRNLNDNLYYQFDFVRGYLSV